MLNVTTNEKYILEKMAMRPWGANEAIQEQVIVAEKDCMLQFLKKLKSYTKLVPETAH